LSFDVASKLGYKMNTLAIKCSWAVREQIGNPPSCAEAKEVKSVAHYAHLCILGLA